jgi:hypothetical protein
MAATVLVAAAFLTRHHNQLVGRADLFQRPQCPERPSRALAVIDAEHRECSLSATTIVATPDQSDSGAIAQLDSSASDCPSGAFEIVMRRVDYVSSPTPTVTVFHKDEGFAFVVP